MTDELKNEKQELRQKFSNKFLNELYIILEKCFLMPKKKKEHFITKERLESDLIKLLQSQKQFTSLKNIKEDIKSLAVYDLKENIIGRIISIDFLNDMVEFENMFMVNQRKSFDEVKFFNIHSLECVAAFDKQKLFTDKFNYAATYRFLMAEDRRVIKEEKKCVNYAFERVVPLTVKVDYYKFHK